MSRSRERKEGARLKRIEPLPLPVELELAFREVEMLGKGEREVRSWQEDRELSARQ